MEVDRADRLAEVRAILARYEDALVRHRLDVIAP
jgi:hypothetical protein